MDNKCFINEAFTFAINKYIDSKNFVESEDYNSFFVVVMRTLMAVYDELDILNPFYFNDEKLLIDNITKYGYGSVEVDEFLKALQAYYEKETDDGFVFIQKRLIDMFIEKYKSMKISDDEINNFKNLLYSPKANSPLIVSYNFLMAKNPNEIIQYFEQKLAENEKVEPQKVKETLNLEAYEILRYSLEDIKQMSASELDDVNKKVYNYFDINANAINKKYLLDKAVYDYNHPKSAFSTGNGYVDILFILSIVATLGMIIFVITLLVL